MQLISANISVISPSFSHLTAYHNQKTQTQASFVVESISALLICSVWLLRDEPTMITIQRKYCIVSVDPQRYFEYLYTLNNKPAP